MRRIDMDRTTLLIENRKARYDYFVQDRLECGIVLHGNEVKSIAAGQASIQEAWCTVQDNNLVIRGMHITRWNTSNQFDIDEDRERRLLAHKSEIRKLSEAVKLEGVTLIPLKLFFAGNGKCKIEIGICRGKKNYDKRETIKKRDIERAIRKE